MYSLYREKYLNTAKKGVTLDLYLKILNRFSLYIHFLPQKSRESEIVNNFFKKQPINDIEKLESLPRKYLYLYISSINLLENTEFVNYFPNINFLDEKIYNREILKFTSDIFSDLMRSFCDKSYNYKFPYYKSLVKLINCKKDLLDVDIYFLILFAIVFSKDLLFDIIDEKKLIGYYNNLNNDKCIDKKILLTLLIDIDKKIFLENNLHLFDNLSLDSKFILLSYMY